MVRHLELSSYFTRVRRCKQPSDSEVVDVVVQSMLLYYQEEHRNTLPALTRDQPDTSRLEPSY